MKTISFLVCAIVFLFSNVGIAQEASPTPTDKQIKVYVTGGVSRKGSYFMPATASLFDAIMAAGGFQNDAAGVALFRGSINGHARLFTRFKAKAVLDGTKNETLLDGDIIKVDVYFSNQF